MIDKTQESVDDQSSWKETKQWMLQDWADVPPQWADDDDEDDDEDDDDDDDQPHGRGYPILGPIQPILDDRETEGSFRFPTDEEIGVQLIEKSIKEQGTDALAWYRPFHMDPQEKWGITILDRGIWYIARYLAKKMYFEPPYTEDEIMHCRDIAKDFLYHHEMFHFKVELAATVMEMNKWTIIYARYWSPQTRGEWFDSPSAILGALPNAPLEEALANSYARDKVISEYSDLVESKVVRSAINQFMKTQPDGYKHASKVTGKHTKWKRGVSELINKLLNEDEIHFSPEKILATHVLFDGIQGKEDWIEERYEGIVPCRILDTGFAQGRFARSGKNFDFGIWCVSKDFSTEFKQYNGAEKRKFQILCALFKRCTNGQGLKSKDGYLQFCTEHGASAKYLGTSEWETDFHYFRFFGKQYRVYHETASSGEEVLLSTHYGGDKTLQKQLIRALEKTTPRPVNIVKHEINCNNQSD